MIDRTIQQELFFLSRRNFLMLFYIFLQFVKCLFRDKQYDNLILEYLGFKVTPESSSLIWIPAEFTDNWLANCTNSFDKLIPFCLTVWVFILNHFYTFLRLLWFIYLQSLNLKYLFRRLLLENISFFSFFWNRNLFGCIVSILHSLLRECPVARV